jgi:hypothetical protein
MSNRINTYIASGYGKFQIAEHHDGIDYLNYLDVAVMFGLEQPDARILELLRGYFSGPNTSPLSVRRELVEEVMAGRNGGYFVGSTRGPDRAADWCECSKNEMWCSAYARALSLRDVAPLSMFSSTFELFDIVKYLKPMSCISRRACFEVTLKKLELDGFAQMQGDRVQILDGEKWGRRWQELQSLGAVEVRKTRPSQTRAQDYW